MSELDKIMVAVNELESNAALRDLIAAALADAERKGAEAMRASV